MLPVIIEEYINKLSDKSTHTERRQFYHESLVKIKHAVDRALKEYETERNFKK